MDMDVDEEEVEVSRVRGNKRPQRGHGAYKIRHLIVCLSLSHSLTPSLGHGQLCLRL